MRTVKLGEVVKVIGGGTPRKSEPSYYGGGVPWVTPKDMKASEVGSSLVTLTQAGVSASPVKVVPKGSTLVVVRSGILKHTLPVAIAARDVTVNQDMKALIPAPNLDSRYLTRFIKSREAVVLTWVRATTADNFPIQNLLELDLPLPSLDEQRRIAAILDQADAIRTKRRQVLAHLDALPEQAYRERFGTSVATARVEDLASPGKSSIRTGPFGSQLLHGEFVDQGVAVLGLDNVVGNTFAWAKRRYITEAKYRKLERYTVRGGDVLISIMGTTGRCVVAPDGIPTAINTKHICAITPDRSRIHPALLRAAFLWHPQSRAYLRRQTKGSIMDGLNMGIIKGMPVPEIPLDQQLEFADLLAATETRRSQVEEAAGADDALFASLQARAFRGEL